MGEWAADLSHCHKCVLVAALQKLNVEPAMSVLDWGSGCGHKLTWAVQLFGVNGFGIDIIPENVQWAQNFAPGHYCLSDGRSMDWVPDNHFDRVISYAALHTIHKDEQCLVVQELIEKLKPGGVAWFGWNNPKISFYSNCPSQHCDPSNITDFALPSHRDQVIYPPEVWWRSCIDDAEQTRPKWSTLGISVSIEVVPDHMLFPDDVFGVLDDVYIFHAPAYSLFITRAP